MGIEFGQRSQSIGALLLEFDRYLAVDRGASAATRDAYGRQVRVFLAARAACTGFVDLSVLSAREVRGYVTDLTARYSRQSVKLIATAIRCFLRFARMSGYTVADLSGAVGVVIVHRFGRLPRSLSSEQLHELLAVPDRATRSGARDFAVLLVLSRLGLRASEAAGLRLDDFDWRAGTVLVRVKGDRLLRLPMPNDVGEAVVDYLRMRPRSAHREVFLRLRGSALPLTRGAVTQIVQRCAAKAGLGVVHAHRLRHTTARMVLDAGGSLSEVGELLGHSTKQVTMVYASLDLLTLRPLARAWPGEDRHV